MEPNNIFDTIIVGGGAAGLTAAIYASRRAMKTLLLTQDIGGQAATTDEIENYPGVGFVSGPELMNKFKEQAEKFGTTILTGEVLSVTKEIDAEGKLIFVVATNTVKYVGYSVILAYGLTHRHLDVPGEKELGGRGVSYCATCDGPLFKGKIVAVVGGGNSAVDAALLFAKICPRVYLIHRSGDFKAEAVLVEQLRQPQIEVVLNSTVKEIKGEARVQEVVVQNINDSTERSVKVDGIFIEVGYVVNSKLIEGLVELDNRKQIKISPDAETSQPGILAAGDITTISYKQIVISAGWGATAALKAYEYLQKTRGFRGVNIDWGVAKPLVAIKPKVDN
ncbi:MAG: FAD-dependent oxidoreductase [Candidatus Kerfeldbacteria bacterium]|nr:FAD-dependent oxidoreductase [Candidatus Kerfeldbacteria bacterium]